MLAAKGVSHGGSADPRGHRRRRPPSVHGGRAARRTHGARRGVARDERSRRRWSTGSCASSPQVVAIDAPQGWNRRLLGRRFASLARRATTSSCAVASVSTRCRPRSTWRAVTARLPDWIAAGFELFRALRRRGFESPPDGAIPGAFGQPPAVIEVYPYAAFVTLLGHRPRAKTERAGPRRPRARPASGGRGVGRLLRPRLPRRAGRRAHGVALPAGPRDARSATRARGCSGCRSRGASSRRATAPDRLRGGRRAPT